VVGGKDSSQRKGDVTGKNWASGTWRKGGGEGWRGGTSRGRGVNATRGSLPAGLKTNFFIKLERT